MEMDAINAVVEIRNKIRGGTATEDDMLLYGGLTKKCDHRLASEISALEVCDNSKDVRCYICGMEWVPKQK